MTDRQTDVLMVLIQCNNKARTKKIREMDESQNQKMQKNDGWQNESVI